MIKHRQGRADQGLAWIFTGGVWMRNWRHVTRAAALAISLGLAACSTTAPVPDLFPSPVVNDLGLTAGIRYTEEFSNYTYTEAIPGEHKWIVTMGSANVAMFNSVFSSIFAETVPLDGTESPRALGRRVDLVVQPEVESYEFATPADWDTHSFTVWITYRIKVMTPEGNLITSWPVRAYGASRHKLFGADESLADATTMAMRDAGAYVSLYFDDEPRIREWMREEAARLKMKSRRPGKKR